MSVKTSYYSEQELALVEKSPIPRHIAIIPDGNRRWAKQNYLKAILGHTKGCEVLPIIVAAAHELGVQVITMYAFSTENWNRPKHEINAIFQLLRDYLKNECPRMVEEGISLQTIGDLAPLPEFLKEEIQTTKTTTANGEKLTLILAINYGARDEIKRALHKIMDDGIEKCAISESKIGEYLDTHQWGDPDLFIRTSGEKRISNFLLWQLSYAEIYTTETLWPDFSPSDLLQAVIEFQKRERRRGL